jgi:ornithine decarboxylase
MMPHAVPAPTIPIAFHRLLKMVAIVDPADAQTKALLEQIRAENFTVEVTERFERQVSEDAGVGAYVALIDGARLEPAAGSSSTPMW